MGSKKAVQARQTNKSEWTQLALGHNNRLPGGIGDPPGGGPRVAVATPPPKPTLTQTFNRAANNIVTKKQIEMLRKKLSQNRHTLEFTPLGSVSKEINTKRDRFIQRKIHKLHKQLSEEKGLKKKFAKAQQKSKAVVQFNRASQGMGM